jgi:hypothetical protein
VSQLWGQGETVAGDDEGVNPLEHDLDEEDDPEVLAILRASKKKQGCATGSS